MKQKGTENVILVILVMIYFIRFIINLLQSSTNVCQAIVSKVA